MIVAAVPLDVPAALMEQTVTDDDGSRVQRVLAIQEGAVSAEVLELLGRLLAHV